MTFGKYIGTDERMIRSKMISIKAKLRYHRNRYIELETEFFKLNEKIGNKYINKKFY